MDWYDNQYAFDRHYSNLSLLASTQSLHVGYTYSSINMLPFSPRLYLTNQQLIDLTLESQMF